MERAETEMGDPSSGLEQSLIDEFVRARGYDPHNLALLPEAERHALLTDASVYASGKLSEIEARAHFVHGLHGAKGNDGAE